MIDFINETDFIFDSDELLPIANYLTDKTIELLFVSDDEIEEINYQYRSKKSPTDVLSFPIEPFAHAPLGTIIISIDTAKRVALDLNHPVETEIKILFIHGLLHLLGFDHEVDNGEMQQEENRLREMFGIEVDGLIGRV